jgi:hypothetical protein
MYLLWLILGSFIGIGPLIAQYLFLHTWNDVNEIHNKELAHPQVEAKHVDPEARVVDAEVVKDK